MEQTAVTDGNMDMQRHCAAEAAALLYDRIGEKRYAHIRTFGCQMNERDSRTMAEFLGWMGFEMCDDEKRADFILINTCCVRAGAEHKVSGLLGALEKQAVARPDLLIGVCGCMTQQDGVGEAILRRFRHVNLVIGTHNIQKFPEVALKALKTGKQTLAVERDAAAGQPDIAVPATTTTGNASEFVNIMYGCDNFCAYCIVPYVRGRERSRDAGDILREIDALRATGVKEVTLLGQNVNSYGKGTAGLSFAGLLKKAAATGIERVRFMTSHPKDMSEDILEAMTGSASICKHIHLPVQSGSDGVLAAMNRGYTSEKYARLVEKAREALPGIGFTSDIIVGFPGESEADFANTLELVRAVRFDSLFTFKYSRRKGTPAYDMECQIAPEIKAERLARLIEAQDAVTAEIHESLVGTRQRVLVEGQSKRGGGVYGRIDRGITANIELVRDEPGLKAGDIADVKVVKAKRNTVMCRAEA